MHPDLNLGLVLVVSAALLRLGNPGNQLVTGAVERFDLSASAFGLLLTVGGLGGLAVVAAAIWVDRRPPGSMMAGGALISLLGIIVYSLSNRLAIYAVGLFVSGVGYSALFSLIFYAIAAKGATRHRGLLIGALGAVFSVPLSISGMLDWWIDHPLAIIVAIIAIGAPFTLAGAALLFLLLPRVYKGHNDTGETDQGETGTTRIWSAVAWVTLAYFVANMAKNASDLLYTPNLVTSSLSALDSYALQPVATHIVIGFSVLLWGTASDYISVRRLFLLTALVLIIGTGIQWVAGDFPVSIVGIVMLSLASGGLICLPWILMADMLPTRNFAKLSLIVSIVGGLPAAAIGPTVLYPLYFAERFIPIFSIITFEGIALAIVARLLPRPRASEINSPVSET